MADTVLSDFPTGMFAAFSTAKMSYFLPVRDQMAPATVAAFFGDDLPNLTQNGSVLQLKLAGGGTLTAHSGDIIAKFKNGKYKVIDETYYEKNFNAPITDDDGNGLT